MTRRCGRRSRGALRGGGQGGAAPTTVPPPRTPWSSPPPLAKPTPRIIAAPPPPAADFLSGMSTPTRHETRPLRHKKEADVGMVAVAAGLIGLCAIAVLLFAIYYFNQPAGSGGDDQPLFGPARAAVKQAKPKAAKRSSDAVDAAEGRKIAPVSQTSKSGPPGRSQSAARPPAQSGDDLPPGPYNNRSPAPRRRRRGRRRPRRTRTNRRCFPTSPTTCSLRN